MRNVLYLSSTAAGGGGPRHMLDWMKAINSHAPGAIRLFAALPSGKKFSEPIASEAVAIFALPERWLSLVAFYGILKFCRANKISIIHSFGRISGLYARPLRLFGFTVIHTPQGVVASSVLKQIIFRVIEPLLSILTYRYVSGSPSEAEQTSRQFRIAKKKIEVIPPVIIGSSEASEPSEATSAPVLPQEFESTIRLGFVGRLVSHKRVLDLIHASLKLGPQFRLTLFGDGPLKPEIEQLKVGHEDRLKIEPLSANVFRDHAMDIFVSWSKSESFGLAAAEAMTEGLPVVLSDVAGHEDLVAGSLRGWIFDAESPPDFARTVEQVLANPDERQIRSLRAKKEIRELCSDRTVAAQLKLLYEETPGH